MKSTRLRHLLFLLTSTAALHAQSLIEQDCTIQIQSTGVKLLNWTGHVGRTYFIQSSPDLANWSWAPNIEAGENRPMSYEVDGPAKAGFFRLQYTDLTAPNLDSADFDSDGLTNLEEITQRPRPTGASLNQSLQTNSVMPVPMSTRQISRMSTRAILSEYIQTNPLKADTDDDGLTDKWEEDHQLDPTDNGGNNPNSGPNGDPDQDGLDNLSELQNGTNPMNEDTNGDGVSDSDDYHSAPLVWPVIWTHNFIEAWAAKSTPLFREFVPTISSATPTQIVRWYMQKDIFGFNGQSTSFPTNLHDSYRVRQRVDPDSGEVTYSITEEPIEQEQGPWLDFKNGNWYIESESHHEVTKTRDFYESIDHVTLRTLGITGVETHRYETNLSNEFTTAMLMQDLGERFNELQREKEQEPWNFGGSGISGITSFISRSEEKSQKMKCDYAMEPPSSPVSSNVRIAWLEVSAPNPYRGDIAIDDDPRPPVVKLYQEFFTAARLVQFNRPIDSSQPASPKTAVHTLSPDQNQEMKVIPLACELKLYHRLGTLVANQQTGGTIAPTPDWSAPTNGSLGWSISGTLGSRPQANDSPQNTDVLWDEFNVPIRLEVIEGAENIRLATRSDAGNGIESFTPVTLPIADLREYPSGFVLQSTGPGRVVIRASLVTKHGLRIVSTTEGLMGLLDLDVDSDNSGEIDGSLAEDEMEADPAQPGKLFVYTPSSGDAPGSPESWVEVSLKTSSLRARDKVQFNYDDDQMTIWNSRPDQNPAPDKRVVAGQAYMLTELGIVPGTPKSFYVRPGQECSGRQLISVHIIATNQSNGTSSDQVAVNLLPVDLISDLNNDGQITTADNSLRDAAMASGATDEIKDKGTEFIFHNDTLSNGIWDKEDTDPARPATEKDDDDAEEITIKPGITEGEVWLDHPAIAGLSFYKTRECIDKVNLSPTSKFTVSASNPFPDKLFMRADGTLTYPDANPQFEGDLVLKIKVGTNGQEIEAVKMKLTVVKGFGADKYFNASRDYTFESNTKLIVRDIKYASSTFRICTICEELSTLRPIETYHDDPTPDPEHKSPRGIRQVMDVNPDMTIITNGNMVYFSSGMSKWESAIVLALGSTSMTDKCQGGIISDGSGYLNPSSTEAGAVLKPGEGLLAQNTAKFVAQGIDGKWIFDKGHLPKSPPPRAGLGGLSTNYESYARAGADRQFVGYWPHQVGGEDRGCVFTATHIAGNQDVDKFVAAAKTSKVPPFETTRLKLFMLDSGDAAVALAHLSPNGSLKLADFQQANILRLQASYQAGVPYFPNTYMAFKTIKPRN